MTNNLEVVQGKVFDVVGAADAVIAKWEKDYLPLKIKGIDDKAGYKVIVVDSMSHEWAGEGGVLDWAESELDRMAGDDWKKREACKMASWIKPKMEHKKMVQRLLQVKATVILLFRAEEKVKMEKVLDERSGKEKTAIVPIGWQPICEKNLPFELTVSFLLTPDAPGMPKPLRGWELHGRLSQTGKKGSIRRHCHRSTRSARNTALTARSL